MLLGLCELPHQSELSFQVSELAFEGETVESDALLYKLHFLVAEDPLVGAVLAGLGAFDEGVGDGGTGFAFLKTKPGTLYKISICDYIRMELRATTAASRGLHVKLLLEAFAGASLGALADLEVALKVEVKIFLGLLLLERGALLFFFLLLLSLGCFFLSLSFLIKTVFNILIIIILVTLYEQRSFLHKRHFLLLGQDHFRLLLPVTSTSFLVKAKIH